jgi:hemerythrin-like domain-containing protein
VITANGGYLPLLLERLSRDHARIVGVVRQLEVLADDLDMAPDWDGIYELLEFLEYYADKVHHPLEDRVFDHLVNKGLTPTERHLVFRNLGQHTEITGMTETLARTAAQALEGMVIDVPEFQEALAAYVSLQMRHLRFEENQLFPLLDHGLDNNDWNALTRVIDPPEQDAPIPEGGGRDEMDTEKEES